MRSAEYVANELNQYTQIDTASSAFSASPCETFNPEFDDDGNQTLIRTATGTWRVTYNGENRPVRWENITSESNNLSFVALTEEDRVITNHPILSMSYDRIGRRVTKNDQRFVYNGYLQIYNFYSQHQPSTSSFIWDPNEPVAMRPLVWNATTLNSQPSTRYYTHDGNKNQCLF